jgi:hypothetical protein
MSPHVREIFKGGQHRQLGVEVFASVLLAPAEAYPCADILKATDRRRA